ncbi:TPA: murein L,D-transpeptidase [Legionella feeleii]
MVKFDKRQWLKGVGVICFAWVLTSINVYAEQINLPQDTPYQQLEKFIPLYLEAVKKPWQTIVTDKALRIGSRDNAVIALRKRLQKTGELPTSASMNDSYFDKELEKAVQVFQERHGILADGIVGRDTLNALNISPQKRLQQIYINIERWKTFSKQVTPKYIWINVPDYRLRYVSKHKTKITSRVIVGKPTRATPEIDSEITHIIINPYWNVPPTIVRQDLIPKALTNPAYLGEQHIRVFHRDSLKNEIPLNKIRWSDVAINPSTYLFRQDPGSKNALGQIKFHFANSHSVYLHDTPAKELFNKEKRFFSSGCVRLENPLTLFEKIAKHEDSIKVQLPDIKQLLESGRTVTFRLANPIPIRVTYITAWVNEEGVLHFWDDVYQRDHRLLINSRNRTKDLPQPA